MRVTEVPFSNKTHGYDVALLKWMNNASWSHSYDMVLLKRMNNATWKHSYDAALLKRVKPQLRYAWP